MKMLLPDTLKEEPYDLRSDAVSRWQECVNNNLQPPNSSVQAAWDSPILDTKFQVLLDSQIEAADQARLLAISSEHASDWLNAIPISSLGLKMDNSSIRIACGLRLGTALCHPHTCQCGVEVDKFGRHGLSCKTSAGRHPRHTQANDLIKRALNSAHVPAIREPPGLSRKDDKQFSLRARVKHHQMSETSARLNKASWGCLKRLV